jgi:hypothetical protein
MRIKVLWVFLVMLPVLTIHDGAKGQKLHPKLKNRERVIRSVLIIPPRVDVVKSTMKGGEGMLKESDAVAEALQKMVSDALRQKGLNVVENRFAADTVSDNEGLRYALADIQGQYDQVEPMILDKQKYVEKGGLPGARRWLT